MTPHWSAGGMWGRGVQCGFRCPTMKETFFPFASRTMSVMLYRGFLRGRTSGRERTKNHPRALQEAIRTKTAIRWCFLLGISVSTAAGYHLVKRRFLGSDIEPKVDDIAILHHIILSLGFKHPLFL